MSSVVVRREPVGARSVWQGARVVVVVCQFDGLGR